jgi:adenylate cyclase
VQALLNTGSGSPNAGDGLWPIRRRKVLDWLITGTRGERFIDNIFVEMLEKLTGAGLPVARASLHFRTQNPSGLGPESCGGGEYRKRKSAPTITVPKKRRNI